jgi:sec-independent protein translocase protein TatA
MFGSLGAPEILVILVVALIVFGPSKLPDFGKSLGEAIRGFKKAISESEQKPAERNEAAASPENSEKL